MTISGASDIRQQSVSADAAYAKLAGTPLAPYASLFVAFSQQYGIDLNWVLSYLQWENGFGLANTFSIAHKNPWDILCYPYNVAQCGQYPPQNWGAATCRDPGNGYCYAVYPTMEIGIEAGYKLWQSYVQRGWVTWFTSLSVALCGNPAGCADPWVDNVIAAGEQNALQWPYIAPPPPPPPPPVWMPGVAILAVLGTMLLYGSLLSWYYIRKGAIP